MTLTLEPTRIYTGKSTIRMYNADCMRLLESGKRWDLAIVDPPYGLGMGATLNVNSNVKFIDKDWDKEIPPDEYFIELQRVSKNQIVWGGNYFPFLWKTGCKDFIFWNKLNHHDNRSDGEMAWTSFNGLAKYVEYMWDGNRYGTNGNIKGVGKPSIRIHPTEKPVFIYSWLLKNYAKPGDTILDTHGGSMSLAIACWDMGFDLDICELDSDYFNSAVKRFEQHISQQTLF
jgi:site-specific DNA-methyltransferase (adenine-specific)